MLEDDIGSGVLRFGLGRGHSAKVTGNSLVESYHGRTCCSLPEGPRRLQSFVLLDVEVSEMWRSSKFLYTRAHIGNNLERNRDY